MQTNEITLGFMVIRFVYGLRRFKRLCAFMYRLSVVRTYIFSYSVYTLHSVYCVLCIVYSVYTFEFVGNGVAFNIIVYTLHKVCTTKTINKFVHCRIAARIVTLYSYFSVHEFECSPELRQFCRQQLSTQS